MIITLTGHEFAIKQALDQLVSRFVAKFGPHCYERIDGESFDMANIASLLQGASLFAPSRLVVLKHSANNKQLWEALGDWVDKVPSDTTLVVVEPEPDKRTKTYKALKSKTEFKEFSKASSAELVKWLQVKAKELGAEIKPADAQYLVEKVAGDQWRLSHEIEKLAYGKQINRDTIDDLVEPSPEGSAFELLDAALAGNQQKVEKLVSILKYQEDPYKLFGLLAGQVHALAVISTAGERNADQIAKDSGLHPFVIRKTQTAVKNLGAKRIAEIIEQLAQCDMQLKTTGSDPWFLLGLMFQKISKK